MPPALLQRALHRLRAMVARPLAEGARRHPGVAYARGLLLGDLESVAASERLAFRRSGLAHLLAVSGMNVALVAGVAAALASFCGRRLRLGLVASAVLLHLALVGPVPSLLRATLMTAAALLGLMLERRALALQSLAIAATAMAAFDPPLVRESGLLPLLLGDFRSRGAGAGDAARMGGPTASAGDGARGLLGGAGGDPALVARRPSRISRRPRRCSTCSPCRLPVCCSSALSAGSRSRCCCRWRATLPPLPLDLLAVPFQWLPALPTSPWICLPLPPSWGLGLALAVLALVAA